VVIALAMLAPLLLIRPASGQESLNGPIASTALKYLDTYGGQCFTFAKQVVAEATGATIGYDYRLGYFEAGAIEVSADEAQNGDIIQIASDANHGPWASYPGLHTAIILENLGGGRFNAIDSNQNWDEWVRLRPNYDPYAAAARYGLQVHIYRIPGGGPGEANAPAVSAPPVSSGDQYTVSTSGCLNLRTDPSLSGSKVSCLPTGTAVTVTGDAVAADGYSWLPVSTGAGSGWVASQYLAKSGASAAAAPDPTPAPEPTVAAPPPAPPASASGISARVDDSPGCLRVRTSAGLGGEIVDCLAPSTALTITDDSRIGADGYTWVKVSAPGHRDGWVASEFLIR
jgi:uncharacterized protein YraI